MLRPVQVAYPPWARRFRSQFTEMTFGFVPDTPPDEERAGTFAYRDVEVEE